MKDRGIFSKAQCAPEESDKELIARNYYRRRGPFTVSTRDLERIARILQGELESLQRRNFRSIFGISRRQLQQG